MMSLTRKIDFAVIFSVINANPNGDPLNGNRPRVVNNDIGEVSDVCLKRKIRDRLLEEGENIFVQSDDRKTDDAKSLKVRAEKVLGKLDKNSDEEEIVKNSCATWFDVRAFGQIFAFSSVKGLSVGIRGPVSIHSAFSVEPLDIIDVQITKSVNADKSTKKTEDNSDNESQKSSDRMGMKFRVTNSIYVFFGSMNPQLAERTKFSDKDADVIKCILPKLFENDASSARPEGSMSVKKVFWWKHNCKAGQYSSAKVHGSLKVNADGSYELHNLDGLEPEIIEGF